MAHQEGLRLRGRKTARVIGQKPAIIQFGVQLGTRFTRIAPDQQPVLGALEPGPAKCLALAGAVERSGEIEDGLAPRRPVGPAGTSGEQSEPARRILPVMDFDQAIRMHLAKIKPCAEGLVQPAPRALQTRHGFGCQRFQAWLPGQKLSYAPALKFGLRIRRIIMPGLTGGFQKLPQIPAI